MSGSPDADEDTGNPDDHDADGMGDDRELKALGAFSSEPVLKEVGEHAHAERDEHVGEENPLGDPDFLSGGALGEGADFMGIAGLFDGGTDSA